MSRPMQATLDATALKRKPETSPFVPPNEFLNEAFSRALTCLSKYGDELTICATPDGLSLSATNSSKSAYCRFTYETQFFSKYRVGCAPPVSGEVVEVATVTGQLLTKSLLSVLRHRAVDKTVERCDLIITQGAQSDDEEDSDDQDGLASLLVVRLHCKHGVVKTHRLSLSTLDSLLAPGVPDSTNESRLTIGPRALKDLIEHFPSSKGMKSDPQLIWTFGDTEVAVKSLESSLDSRSKGQLNTELTISAEEFDVYDMYATPVVIAFHLREFNATIAFADSMSLPMELRFTDPAAPLFIDVEAEFSVVLFVISTSQVGGMMGAESQSLSNAPTKKRLDPPRAETPRIKKSMKVVQRSETLSNVGAAPASRSPAGSVPPVSHRSQDDTSESHIRVVPEPLFLPSASQMSAAEEEVLRSTGLGIETMNADELTAMLEGDGEEVSFDPPPENQSDGQQIFRESGDSYNSLDIMDEMEFAHTQTASDNSKAFQPLFDD